MKEKIITWVYRTFSYIIPGGIALYTFLIDKLLDSNVSVTAKIGVSGIFCLVIILLIAIYFYGRHLRKKLNTITNELLECVDIEKKKELVLKKRKIEATQELFHNAIFLAPFVALYFIMLLVEKTAISMRGTLFYIMISMATGFGFNCFLQWIKTHDNKEK